MEKCVCQELLSNVSDIVKRNVVKRKSGEDFNFLDICRIGTDEVRHSAIIAALLDPHGTHGLQNESLKIFLRQAGLPNFADKCKNCEVRTEVTFAVESDSENYERRMDIVISNSEFCVVIENKTGTVDHYKQLADYRDWLKRQPQAQKKLLYLTYEGIAAMDSNIEAGEYLPVSYRKHIVSWLNACQQIAPKRSCAFFAQYEEFLKNTLLGENEMKKDLNVLLNSTETMTAAAEIAKNFPEIRKQKFIGIFNEWMQSQKLRFSKKLINDNSGSNFIFDSSHPAIEIAFEFGVSGFCDFYYGLGWKKEANRIKRDNAVAALIPKDWNCNSTAWICLKYFSGDFRNPGEHPEFLFEQKEKLFAELDRALNELQQLVATFPAEFGVDQA